ncbi:MAG: YidC/Oxa1 family membrane protein insertase [Lachnospiraceae bacterium]
MAGLLLTQATTPIIGQVAWLLGKLMNGIFNVLSSAFGIQNIGLCIIIFTLIIYTLMIPLTIKQQKFSKMSAVMNPELQAIQKKYKNKKDQASMTKQQEEMQLVYQKYGTSPTGGCLQMVIQMPILFGLYKVIQNMPAYVDGIKNAYMPLVDGIMSSNGYQNIIETIGKAKPIMISPEKYDYSQVNTIIDVLYKFQATTWDTLIDKFPALESVIDTTIQNVGHLNNFFGLNIANTPMSTMMDSFKAGAIGIAILALLIPIISGLTQWLNIKLMPQAPGGEDNPMASSMKTMNMTMPLFSVFMCFTLPTGLGLYWIASAVFRSLQQLIINRSLNHQSMDELVKKNMEKASKKLEKKGAATGIAQKAQTSARNYQEPKKQNIATKKVDKEVTTTNNPTPGSLASKAGMVKKFNEND